MNRNKALGHIYSINGPVVKGLNLSESHMREMVLVGHQKRIGEIIGIKDEEAIIQVYEDTDGLMLGEPIEGTGEPLSLYLGPGMVGNIFDGIGRPLSRFEGDRVNTGYGLLTIDRKAPWEVTFCVDMGSKLRAGECFARVQETKLITHALLVPIGIEGEVIFCAKEGVYTAEDILIRVLDDKGREHPLTLMQKWPVRTPRPVNERLRLYKPLITGQRILDVFFPIAKGGTAAIPGGFGTGKTMTQHQLAKWSDADLIIYIGCGERGNEMTDVLEEFPKIVDPKSGHRLIERTILIANTSNMPVAAREASIYTGITMAEYFRDMGYHVAIMADSTSRWAEALREISGRLEEMPAEEGYPAYLSYRLAEFYERAGYVETLSHQEGSITIIGAVSPAGGDFSEPVTENTKRYINVFLALDRKLAYARHYPAINWLASYSGYLNTLGKWYETNVAEDVFLLRGKMMRLLQEESKLLDIVQLVGEDVLPDDQRLLLEIARIFKIGFLQQNAMHPEDTFVPLNKQYQMLGAIWHLYVRANACLSKGIPLSNVRSSELFDRHIKMKYDIPNDFSNAFNQLKDDVDAFYDMLLERYHVT